MARSEDIQIMATRRRQVILTALFTFIAVRTVRAADAPEPVTFHPDYVVRTGVSPAAPGNIRAVRDLLTALQIPIDDHSYYAVNWLRYSVNSDTLGQAHWLIYYAPWERKVSGQSAISFALSRLNDPLSHSNYTRTRIYGSGGIHVIPAVLWPALNLGKLLPDAGGKAQVTVGPQFRRSLISSVAKDLATDDAYKVKPALLNNTDAGDLTKVANALAQIEGLQLVPGLRLQGSTYAQGLQDAETALDRTHVITGSVPQIPEITVSILADADQIPKQNSISAEANRFVAAFAAWIVRETLTAYIVGMPTLAPADVTGVTAGGKIFPFGISKAEAGKTKTSGIYIPQGLEGADSKSNPYYRVTITARTPQPWSDLKGILGIVFGQGARPPLQFNLKDQEVQKILEYAAATSDVSVAIPLLPSDVTIDALRPDKPSGDGGVGGGAAAPGLPGGGPQPVNSQPASPPAAPASGAKTQTPASDGNTISSVKLQNEKPYHFGFAFAIPLKSWDAVQYDSTDGIITSKTVEKQNLFAMVEGYPYATDTSSVRLRLLPAFMGGLPISGKPLNQQVYAGSIGLWKVEVFCGVQTTRSLVPTAAGLANTTPNVSATAGSLNARWGTHLTYGVVIPVSVVKSLLSSSKSQSTTSKPPAGGGSPKPGN